MAGQIEPHNGDNIKTLSTAAFGGSKRNRHKPVKAGSACPARIRRPNPQAMTQIRRFFSLHLRLECYIIEPDTNVNGGIYYAGTETAHGLEHLEYLRQGY